MGHHYVPQEYLRGFADPGDRGMIWMYDKHLHHFVRVSIRSAAQQAGYYNADTEKQLSELVEGPAHKVLQKLRSGDRIDESERAALALYIGTMLMRVPRRRRKALEVVPETLVTTINRVSAQIAQWARTTAADPQLVSRRLAELEQAREKFQKEIPAEIIEQIRAPWPTERILTCIVLMTWRIVSANSAGFFITSDNPAVFFEAFGLGRPESELTFPLCSDLALLGSWRGPRGETFLVKAKPALVKEVPRRVASSAERFVFHHAKQDWVRLVAENQNPYLSRIQW